MINVGDFRMIIDSIEITPEADPPSSFVRKRNNIKRVADFTGKNAKKNIAVAF
jgi:hypothetical protein